MQCDMIKKGFQGLFLILLLTVLGGCGDENFFKSLADDGSRQAKLEDAQKALDKEDCQTALDLYTEVYGSNPSNVEERMNLAGAHLCKAGFSTTTLIEVAADFGAGVVLDTQLFNEIADKTVNSLNSDWPTNLNDAKTLLAASPLTSPPTPYNNDPAAGFNLSVVMMVQSVMTVVDILNFVNGVVDCTATQGSTTFTNCEISEMDDVPDIINNLQDAADILTNLGVTSDVVDTVNTVLDDLKAIDGNPNDTTTCPDIEQYLVRQGITTSGTVTCTP